MTRRLIRALIFCTLSAAGSMLLAAESESGQLRKATFLDEQELWDVTAYIYEFTDWEPRKQEVHH